MPVRLVSQEELDGPLKGYRLLERLGRGGFGEVWKVEAPGGLLKAMKFVFGDLDSAEDDGRPAEQELKALHRVKAIRHPYILSLERFDIIDGQLIIVMELADRNLWDRFRQCRASGMPGIPRDELLRYLEETAEALDLMNNHYQIQHLDIKPQNIFLVFNHIKVADFGLAKVFEGARATVTGGVTPVYAAPETFEGWISRYSDQYSLAIVYQELLTGKRPIDGANTRQLLLKHLNDPPDLSPLSEADRPVIARAMAKKPDDRWPSCMDMVRALKMGAASAVTPPPGSLGHETGLSSRSDTPLPESPSVPPPPTPYRARPTAPTRQAPPLTMPGNLNLGGSLVSTPRPALVTPKLVTPQAGSAPNGQTLPRQQIMQTARMTSLGIAPPERTGDGSLFPALMVGVGQVGLSVLRKFRRLIRERFGGLEALPTIRFLYIDTDPEAVAAATQGPEALAAREVILTRLNRPAHYLQQSFAPNIETWMPPGLLYQLPKNPGPAAGVRAFGRLALCDNYRLIAQRIRQEIETFLTDEALEQAGKETGLGVRTNRPRAYLVTGLAGGTGSGMFVDLAYVLKHELRAVGYRKPEAISMLFVPPADGSVPRNPAMANTFAALSELYHYASGTRYQNKFDPNEPPILDPDGPFTRSAIVPLPRIPKEKDRDLAFGLAARGLFTEMLTPAGRVTDYVRSVAPLTGNSSVPVVHLFGLYRLSFPRAEMLSAATRRFSQRLLQRWAAKETTHLREPITQWLTDQWAKQQIDPAAVLTRFQQAAKEVLRETPGTVFDAAVDTLRPAATTAQRLDPSVVCTVLDQLLKLVGKPDSEHEPAGSLEDAIRSSYRSFASEVEVNFGAMAVQFIELPQYRLAGAEEALTQLTDRLKQTVERLEQEREILFKEVRESYSRLLQLIGTLGNTSGLGGIPGRKAAHTTELLEALRAYPHRRLSLAERDAALALYRGLLGTIPDYLRDVNYCRIRLGELGQMLAAAQSNSVERGLSTLVLPDGCATLDDAADQFIGGLSPEDLLSFDVALQQTLQQEVAQRLRKGGEKGALVKFCLKTDWSQDFISFLTRQARGFLDARLEHTDPATVFLRYRGQGRAAEDLMATAYRQAAPAVATVEGTPPADVAVLALPPGEAGSQVRQLASFACPGVEFIPAPLPDDMLIYRECSRVELTSLNQAGAHARDAYLAQLGTDPPPHTRADVPWPVPGADPPAE